MKRTTIAMLMAITVLMAPMFVAGDEVDDGNGQAYALGCENQNGNGHAYGYGNDDEGSNGGPVESVLTGFYWGD